MSTFSQSDFICLSVEHGEILQNITGHERKVQVTEVAPLGFLGRDPLLLKLH